MDAPSRWRDPRGGRDEHLGRADEAGVVVAAADVGGQVQIFHVPSRVRVRAVAALLLFVRPRGEAGGGERVLLLLLVVIAAEVDVEVVAPPRAGLVVEAAFRVR
jgi:hypothetical protein